MYSRPQSRLAASTATDTAASTVTIIANATAERRVSRARGGVRAELVAAPGQHRDAEPDGDHERERVGHLKDGHRGDVQLGVGQPPREEDVHLRRPPLRHHQDPGNRQPEELAPSRGGGAKTPPVPRRLPGEVALDEGEVADVDAQDDAVGPRGGERRARVSEPEDADEDDVRGDVKERGDDARDRTGSGDALGLHVGLRGDVPRVEEETGDETREVRGGGAGDVRVLTHGEKRGLGGGPQRGDGEGREGEDEERALGDVPEGGVGAGAVGLAADGGDGGRHPDEDRVSGDVSEGRGERGARQREGAEVAHERHGREAHDAIADHAQADRERQVELGSSLAAETAQRHRRLALLILAQRVVVVERSTPTALYRAPARPPASIARLGTRGNFQPKFDIGPSRDAMRRVAGWTVAQTKTWSLILAADNPELGGRAT